MCVCVCVCIQPPSNIPLYILQPSLTCHGFVFTKVNVSLCFILYTPSSFIHAKIFYQSERWRIIELYD